MKQGSLHSLTALATELERRAANKQDLIVDTRHAQAEVVGDEIKIGIGQLELMPVTDLAHRQIGEHTGVPAIYYDKMRKDAPDLLAANINRWLRQDHSNRLVRVLDGKVRAFLSDRYKPLENEDLAGAVLPVLLARNDLDVMSAEVTDRRLYMKVVDKSVSRELAKTGNNFGDGKHKIIRVASPAITISNSEVGMGAVSVLGGVYDGFCSNLATFGERSVRKYHIGAKHELLNDDTYQLLSDDTKKLTDQTTMAQIADVVAAAFDRAKFDSLVDKIEGTAADKIVGDPVKAVSFASKRLGLSESEGQGVLRALIEGADLSRFGLYNAVTRASQEVADYDRATELERIGGRIIELPDSEWRVIKEAA